VSINRTQALVLGFFVLTWTSLVTIFGGNYRHTHGLTNKAHSSARK
jgi:hypothetical protein